MTSTTSIGVKHPVIHFEIMGRDPAALSKFYADVFGWSIAPPMSGDPTQYNIIDTGHVTFYIRVDDVEAAFAQIEARGGSRMMGPQDVPMPNGASITIGLFRDPEGRTIGLVDVGDAM
ncbi:MAG TPA: VOC family protein [Verrucomicrobiae bacterium]|nr:VOC family protein [Verrucomicrobiae bacterium]